MTNNADHIVIVDDEAEIRRVIVDYLAGEGFRCSAAANGAELEAILAEGDVDLVILDLRLDGEDGLDIARRLHRESDVGIIILSVKSDLTDQIVGLEIGADHYITKPFELRDILARVKSVLRRVKQGPAQRGGTGAIGRVGKAGLTGRFSGYVIDTDARTLHTKGGAEIDLTAREYDILEILLRHNGKPVSRDAMLEALHGGASGPFDRSVDVQIGRLRQKLEPNPRRPELVRTVRNAGYLIDTEIIWD